MQFYAAVVGASFRPAEAKEAIKALEVGDELYLERDPDNQYDPNAVKVLVRHYHIDEEVPAEEIFIGFIEKEVAAEIAPYLDEELEPTVTVHSFLSTIKPYVLIDFPD